jgi:ribose 5-phosphate isomerase
MSTSIVKVYNSRYGKWAKGARVVLGFSMGMTTAVYTNEQGIAVVNHSSTGQADVYIDGKEVGKMRCPGEATFTVSL